MARKETHRLSFSDQIALLESLQVIDVELRRVDDALGQQNGELATQRAEQKRLEDKLAADRASLADMERTRSELMIEVRQMSQQIDRSREKLSRSRNERENQAVQRELEELRKLLRDREDEIQKLAMLAEAARGSIEEGDKKRQKIVDDLGGREGETTTLLAQLTAERAEKFAARTEIAKQVNAATLRRYDLVRSKRGTGVAKTTLGTCLSCHMQLPPMLYQKLMRREAFEQCPSCARILYFEPPRAATGDGTT